MKRILATLFTAMLMVASLSLAAQKPANDYRLVLSFTSIGTGVPDAKAITDYISKFKKQNRVRKITASKLGPLGREGEYELGFRLNELTPAQRKSFITTVKKIAANTVHEGSINVTTDVPLQSNRPSIAKTETIVY